MALCTFRGTEHNYVPFGYGQNDLFVAFRCEEPSAPVAGKADGDERSVFHGDTVEVFLDANHDRKTYWQFALDASGQKYDGVVLDAGRRRAYPH